MIYPSNKLLIVTDSENVDVTNMFGMILLDGYDLGTPEQKTYEVDIPGGNGKIDLTDSLIGDCVYNNRDQKLNFIILDESPKRFAAIKTNITNYFHGKDFNYKFSFDEEYTYHGRFTISDFTIATGYSNYDSVITFAIEIDAEPFKHKKDIVYSLSPIGGQKFDFVSGRERVRPTIECYNPIRVIFKDNQIDLPIGTWTLNDCDFTEGVNNMYISSYQIHGYTWKAIKDDGVTWGDFKNKDLYEWYKIKGLSDYLFYKWTYLENQTWASVADKTWGDYMYWSDVSEEVKNIYLQYKWGDL